MSAPAIKYIFLVRHGKPQTPDERSYCLGGGSDYPLAPLGVKQARALARCFAGLELDGIYSSRLKRAWETAAMIAAGREIETLEGIEEISVGAWENKPFEVIKANYADIYAARGLDWSITPPGGETLAGAAARMEAAVRRAVLGAGGNLLIVTHDGVIRALLWKLMRLDTRKDAMIRQPYGSVTVLECAAGKLTVTAAGKLPEDTPRDEEIEELWHICATPPEVRDHCAAVCEEALALRERLLSGGTVLSHELLRAASLLHDLCRAGGRGHAARAAAILRGRGYLRTAQLIEAHHSCAFGEALDEEQVLFLADKYLDGAERVTLAERFGRSAGKCRTPEAKAKHAALLAAALQIQEKIVNRGCAAR
ncbi:MAG: histidine phosphatase family protein [Gracilibacteraceae bacterium]|jgi:broad specificity phosphatase PhoE|nr:histidine phosphatase family protein [Gracilibacteraceae bacterium]